MIIKNLVCIPRDYVQPNSPPPRPPENQCQTIELDWKGSYCHDHSAELDNINPESGHIAIRSGEIWLAGISGTGAKMSTWQA